MEIAENLSASLDTIRNCTIEITNMSDVYNLINPQVYMYSGNCCDPPQPTISSNKTGVCAFTQIADTARGAVGVLTYNLCHMENQMCTERMAILFSVPYDYNLYENIFGVGLFESTRPCDEALYNEMYYGEDFSHFTRGNAKDGEITYKGDMIELIATMSNVGKAIIKVEMHDMEKK